jgi:flavin reductase (DIM6/NTAB) family NADH-FMN oxidoreductase RutF
LVTQDQKLELRRSLGRFATGVTVVTCLGDQGPCGITANSFSSVSLEPPLVLWNIAKVSHSLQAYLTAEYFAVNVLSAEQRHLSNHFAQSDHTVFNGVDYDSSADNVPLLPGTIACFECRTYAIHECGDHYIIVGEVQRFRSNDEAPLLFFGSEYHGHINKL